jgi:magnesium-transporting ATPase (P-type)
MRDVPEAEYQQWSQLYNKAAATINGRQDELDKVSEMIERDLELLGATAIEDKLQEGVPDTIFTLQQAGIKVWVLTGDRQETAINIGMSCRLISESMSLVRALMPSNHIVGVQFACTGHRQRREWSLNKRFHHQEAYSHQESTQIRRSRRTGACHRRQELDMGTRKGHLEIFPRACLFVQGRYLL